MDDQTTCPICSKNKITKSSQFYNRKTGKKLQDFSNCAIILLAFLGGFVFGGLLFFMGITGNASWLGLDGDVMNWIFASLASIPGL